MSDNLPEKVTRHHKLFITDPRETDLLRYCTEGLLIPEEHIDTFTRSMGVDAWYVTVKGGHRFLVSGPELEDFKACEDD